MKGEIAGDKYGLYCVPDSSRHRPAARRILSGETHENMTLTQIIWYMEADDKLRGHIVHAGAYFGDWLPALSSVCPPDREVLAFEPCQENFECAAMTLRLNHIDNVTIYNVALGDQDAEADMLISDPQGRHLGGGCRIVGNKFMEYKYERVKVVRLDDVIVEHPVSVIHLDVEGYEQRALDGALDTILRNKPFLVIETVPPDRWLRDHLHPLGYEKVAKIEGNTIFEVRR